MDIALVTGAERGIGLQISRKLLELGYRVYGLAPDFTRCALEHAEFLRVPCNLADPAQINEACAQLTERGEVISCLVHAAVHEVKNPFEACQAEEIEHVIGAQLLGPLLLTRWALPSLIKLHGHVICVGWNGLAEPPGGALSAAAQGGMFQFGRQLFEELRDTGVKVTTLHPRPNSGTPDPQARINLQPQSAVEPALFAEAVDMVLRFRANNAVSVIEIRPQGTREEPRIAETPTPIKRGPDAVQLPQRENFPREDELIPTPERMRPEDAREPFFDEEDEEDDEDEDDDLDALLAESRSLLKQRREAAMERLREVERKIEEAREGDGEGEKGDGEGGSKKKKRRRRRRGGRNRRDREKGEDDEGKGDGQTEDDASPDEDGDDETPADRQTSDAAVDTADDAEKPSVKKPQRDDYDPMDLEQLSVPAKRRQGAESESEAPKESDTADTPLRENPTQDDSEAAGTVAPREAEATDKEGAKTASSKPAKKKLAKKVGRKMTKKTPRKRPRKQATKRPKKKSADGETSGDDNSGSGDASSDS